MAVRSYRVDQVEDPKLITFFNSFRYRLVDVPRELQDQIVVGCWDYWVSYRNKSPTAMIEMVRYIRGVLVQFEIEEFSVEERV